MAPIEARDATAFIRASLRLTPVAAVAEIHLYAAHSGSRLSRLGAHPPYWAFQWGGGLALARHVLDHPAIVARRRVLDLGAGSGLVAIAAARAGAATVEAAEIDAYGQAAIRLNAEANGVAIALVDIDITAPPPAGIDVLLAGDVFYAPDVAAKMLPFLVAARSAGIDVLIGDPLRRDLPLDRLERIADYPTGDVGDAHAIGAVFRLR